MSAGRQLEASGPTQVLCLVECRKALFICWSLRKDCVRIWDDFCSVPKKSPLQTSVLEKQTGYDIAGPQEICQSQCFLGASVGRLGGGLGRCSRVGLEHGNSSKEGRRLRGRGEHQGDEGLA